MMFQEWLKCLEETERDWRRSEFTEREWRWKKKEGGVPMDASGKRRERRAWDVGTSEVLSGKCGK